MDRQFWKGAAAGGAVVVIAMAGRICKHLRRRHGSDKQGICRKTQYFGKNKLTQITWKEKDKDALAEGMYAGLLYGLNDPYSCYYTAEEYEEQNTETEGSYVGIGVAMRQKSRRRSKNRRML